MDLKEVGCEIMDMIQVVQDRGSCKDGNESSDYVRGCNQKFPD
jgi:hypothetical protein